MRGAGAYCIVWTPLRIPLVREGNGYLVFGATRDTFERFDTPEAAQAALDGDPTMKPDLATVMTVADYEWIRMTPGERRRAS